MKKKRNNFISSFKTFFYGGLKVITYYGNTLIISSFLIDFRDSPFSFLC